MNNKEWEEYRKKCREFDKELTGTINAVMGVSVFIAVVSLFAVIINKFL
ncbi:hypothetical protein WJW27_002750 [Escherichia coli]